MAGGGPVPPPPVSGLVGRTGSAGGERRPHPGGELHPVGQPPLHPDLPDLMLVQRGDEVTAQVVAGGARLGVELGGQRVVVGHVEGEEREGGVATGEERDGVAQGGPQLRPLPGPQPVGDEVPIGPGGGVEVPVRDQ